YRIGVGGCAGVAVQPRRLASTGATGMYTNVLQHVADRVPHLGAGPENVRMIAVGEHLPLALHGAIEALRDPDAEPLQPAGKRSPPIRLHDHVEMVPL